MAKVHKVDEFRSYVDLGKGQIFQFRTVNRFDGSEYKKKNQWSLYAKKEKEFSKYKNLIFCINDADAILKAKNKYKKIQIKKS